MLLFGLLVVGQMAMLLLDNVTQRSGVFHRLEQGQYCAEEGLNLGRAWVMQQAAQTGSVNTLVLSGGPPPGGTGLFVDPANPVDFQAASKKDLCLLSSTTSTPIGGVATFGLGGICRLMPAGDPNEKWCGAGPCALYRMDLATTLDEAPPGPIYPYVDENQAFFIRSECMAQNISSTAVTAATPAQDPGRLRRGPRIGQRRRLQQRARCSEQRRGRWRRAN